MMPTIPPGTPAAAPAAKPPKKLLTQLFPPFPPYTRVNSFSVKNYEFIFHDNHPSFFIEPNNTV